MTTSHVLKTAEPYFRSIADGTKTFELRRNDRGYQVGDVLTLVSVKPGEFNFKPCVDIDCKVHRPAFVFKVITYVFSGDPSLRDCGGILPGYVVLGLANPTEGAP